jgi:hypothetical protein
VGEGESEGGVEEARALLLITNTEFKLGKDVGPSDTWSETVAATESMFKAGGTSDMEMMAGEARGA